MRTSRIFALIRFHARAGVRLASRTFAPLFAALVAIVILNVDPAGAVRVMAAGVFARVLTGEQWVVAVLAFAFPSWAAPRLMLGLNGWIRHLPIDAATNRRGLLFGLTLVQAPLSLALLVLAAVALRDDTTGVGTRLIQFGFVFVSGASAALPVQRYFLSAPLSMAAALVALQTRGPALLLSTVLLLAADRAAGPIRKAARSRQWSGTGSAQELRIALRALGWRVVLPYAAAFLPLGAALLFVTNNELDGGLAAGAWRFGGGLALVLGFAGWAERLAVRRPVWPWARSLPWTAGHRVLQDAALIAVLGIPMVIWTAVEHVWAGLAVLAVAPFLALRSTAYVRLIPQRQSGGGGLILEGFAACALLALVPWSAAAALLAVYPAFRNACEIDKSQTVTLWRERRHRAAGDPLSWSGT